MIDDFNREALGIEVDFSLPSERVIRSLAQIISSRGKPCVIRADKGPELISDKLMECAAKHQIQIQHIQPGKPQQNAMQSDLIVLFDTSGYLSIIGTVLTKFRCLQHNGCLNIIINV